MSLLLQEHQSIHKQTNLILKL